jgi:tripartite-type tricarboxylate transporter receptor subunit TctC
LLDRERYANLPDVPTVTELGYQDLVLTSWFGLAVPKGTPRAAIDRVNAEVMKMLRAPDVVAKLRALGMDPAKPNSPDDFGAFMKEDAARWKKVVKEAGIELD